MHRNYCTKKLVSTFEDIENLSNYTIMKNYLLAILFLVLTNVIFCQEREARILFLDSTSIKGYGEIKKEKIYFRVDLNSEKTEWDYEMVSGIIFEAYGFSEEYEYVKKSVKAKPILMEVIERGNVNLYKDSSYGLKMNFGAPNQVNIKRADELYAFSNKFYLKRPNEEVAIDLTISFKKNAIDYFSDCKAIIEKIEKKELTKRSIPDIVFYYNDYCGNE